MEKEVFLYRAMMRQGKALVQYGMATVGCSKIRSASEMEWVKVSFLDIFCREFAVHKSTGVVLVPYAAPRLQPIPT